MEAYACAILHFDFARKESSCRRLARLGECSLHHGVLRGEEVEAQRVTCRGLHGIWIINSTALTDVDIVYHGAREVEGWDCGKEKCGWLKMHSSFSSAVLTLSLNVFFAYFGRKEYTIELARDLSMARSQVPSRSFKACFPRQNVPENTECAS